MSLFVKNTTIINSRLIVGSTSFVVPTPTPTPSTTPSIVSSGLVIQLDAHESLSYPGTGTTVFDITGGFNHTLIGATYTVRNGIKCFDCTTGNNRVTVNGTGPLLPNSGYTYITWARLITSTAGFRTLLYTNSPKYTPITIPNGTNTLGYWDTSFKSSGYDVASSVGVWVQFAVVGTNTSQTFYINGSQVGSTISAGAGGTTHWGWGNNDIAGQPWGHVANMYFYNRQLNLAEITQQYNYLAPRFMEITPTPTNTQTPTTTSTPTPTPTNTSTPTVTPTNTTSPTTTTTPTPTSTPNAPVTSNLVLYYDPSNPLSYSGSGTTINDLSGNGLNGSMSNITFTSPYFSYNGSSSQVSVADNSLLEPGSGDWTIEFWVNHSVIAGASRVLIAKTDGGNSADWGYGLRTISNGNTYMEIGNGSTSITTPTSTLNINTWYQVVGVWTNVASNSFSLYINGSLIGTNSHSVTSIKNTTSPLYIGSFNGGQFAQWLNGRMGVVRMYNKSLTGSEVLQNYNNDYTKYISVTPTPSPSITQTPTITPTPSITPTLTQTPTITPTPSITPTITSSITPTLTQTPTITPSAGTGVTFSQTFTGSTAPSTTIENAWTSFRSQLTGTYTTMTMSNSLGTSLTVNDANVQSIANALRTGTTGTNFSVIIGSRTWRVIHGCVAGTIDVNSIFLTSSGGCDCGSAGTYTIRPMIKNLNWGGLNGSSCGQPTQTITLTFS